MLSDVCVRWRTHLVNGISSSLALFQLSNYRSRLVITSKRWLTENKLMRGPTENEYRSPSHTCPRTLPHTRHRAFLREFLTPSPTLRLSQELLTSTRAACQVLFAPLSPSFAYHIHVTSILTPSLVSCPVPAKVLSPGFFNCHPDRAGDKSICATA